MQRLASVLIAILALAVFAAAGYVILKKDPVPHAGRVLPVSPAAKGTVSSATPDPSGSTRSAKGQVVAFLGDDWTAGTEASSTAKSWTKLVSSQLGLDSHNFGEDGTGYAKSTDTSGSYAARVDKIVSIKPDAVVVSGGRNDVSDSQSTVDSDIKTLFTTLHHDLPHATLIAVAPMWGDSAKPPELTDIGTSVDKNVTAVGGQYLAIHDPLHGHPSWMSSNQADPNDTGYAAIAKALATPLQAALTK